VHTKSSATQQRGQLTSEQATIEAQLAELRHCKSTLDTKWVIIVNLTNAQPSDRDLTTAINREGAQCPAFARASQNMVVMAALLDTLPTPTTDGVNKVYHQLKEILGIADTHQVESYL
jgi:hypothetical protein